MIYNKNGEIHMEGSPETIVSDIAMVMHTFAGRNAKTFNVSSSDLPEEYQDKKPEEIREMVYDTTIEMILERLRHVKDLDGSSTGTNPKIVKKFRAEAAKLKAKYGDEYGFVSYDSEVPVAKHGQNFIQNIVKKHYNSDVVEPDKVSDAEAAKKAAKAAKKAAKAAKKKKK